MSNALFPSLPGLAWNITFTDVFETIPYVSSNKYEVRIPKVIDPTFKIKLTFDFLRDDVNDELNTLRGFFRARMGSFDSFLLDPSALTKKPSDAQVTAQPLTLVGPNLYNAPFVRTNGASGYLETIYELDALTAVYENGVASTPGNYVIGGPTSNGIYDGIAMPGKVVSFYTTSFHTVPRTPTLPLTATFSWYYRVRFDKDTADFNAFLFQLYELKEIDLVTARDLS